MRAPHAALESLADTLRTSAGFASASIDPTEVNPAPVGVWLQPRSIEEFTLSGGGTLTAWLYLIAGNFDTRQTMRLLDDALTGVLDLDLALSDTEPADLAAAVLLPHTTTPLPAYRLAVTLDLSE